MQDLDPFAKTPSGFDFARLKEVFAVLYINARARSGIDHRVQRYCNRGR
jgi:hypothetical protein